MRDFTLAIYEELLRAYKAADYSAATYHDFFQNAAEGQTVVLRHDVDKRPRNSVATAELEASLEMRGTYYFRIVPESFDPRCIQQIADLGHEIGYHYEDLTLHRGDRAKALEHFEKQLALFRTYYPVTTICMHGSPISKWDNRDIWTDADYRSYGVIAEPYFDTDFTQVFYITDTGRSWNKTAVSVRDKVESPFDFKFQTTREIISSLQSASFPNRVLQNIHPQRWTDNSVAWGAEWVMQSMKNQIKRWLFVKRAAGQGQGGRANSQGQAESKAPQAN